MTQPQPKPEALVLFDPVRVPAPLRSRLDDLVAPCWWPGMLTRLPQDGMAPHRFTILVTAHQDLQGAALARLENLRLVVATGTAFDYIDLEHCRSRGITVCNTPGYTGPSVAEHTFALLLASSRHVCALDAGIRRGVEDTSQYLSVDLEGKTVGIIGLGDIGRRIARLALGFRMRVRFVNRSPRIMDGATQVSLEQLLRTADFVILTLPLTIQTRHLIDHEQLRMMKPTSIIVNVSANALINPDALRSALSNNVIAGAALDVAGSTEPYLDMPNLIMTPAHGWYTVECIQRRAAIWINTIAAYLQGAPCNVVS